MFLLESPHRGDSNENTQYTIFNIKKKITSVIQILPPWDSSMELKNKFKTAVVDKPSVF